MEQTPAVDLGRFFAPRSVAIVGASPDATRIRGLLLHILKGNGFQGRMYPINPSYREIEGLACYPSIAAVAEPIDLALVAIPAPAVPKALEECAAAGIGFVIIISSGFAEEGEAGLQDEIAAIVARTGMRVSGPNAEGFHNEPARISATFSPAVEHRDPDGVEVVAGRRVSIVAQSGGMGFALYNRGRALGLPFSLVVTSGNEVDLTAADFFAYAVEDHETGVLLLFIEAIRDAATFARAASRARELGKPVVAVKVGHSTAGERATASHTASMAGWNTAYTAFFRHHGIVEATDPDEAVAIAAALSTAPAAMGGRVAVVTVSGGAGAWAADTIEAAGLSVPELSPELQERIAALIPSYGSARNPVDVTAQAVYSGGLVNALRLLRDAPEIDAVAVVLSMSNEKRTALSAQDLADLLAPGAKPFLFYSYTLPSAFARRVFAGAGAVVIAGLREFGLALRALASRPAPATTGSLTPLALPPEFDGLSGSLAEWRGKRLLAALGLAMPDEVLVRSDAEIAAAMARLDAPLAAKIQSADIPHKTEIGGVALGLADAPAVSAARDAMLARVAAERPDAEIDGVLLAAMAKPGIEMIAATLLDPVFGPMVMVGAGGVATEIHQDAAYRLAPVDEAGAHAMLEELRCWPLLTGFRGRSPADVAALVRIVSRLSEIAAGALPRLRELELNPILVHPAGEGVTIVDALVTLD